MSVTIAASIRVSFTSSISLPLSLSPPSFFLLHSLSSSLGTGCWGSTRCVGPDVDTLVAAAAAPGAARDLGMVVMTLLGVAVALGVAIATPISVVPGSRHGSPNAAAANLGGGPRSCRSSISVGGALGVPIDPTVLAQPPKVARCCFLIGFHR